MQLAFFHPWAVLTAYNPNTELLMVDVRTKNDEMYSGQFRSFIPRGRGFSAIVMRSVIKYSAPPKENHGPGPLFASQQGKKFKLPRLGTKKRFIPNVGTIVVKAEHVSDVHFWTLPKGHSASILVEDANEMELLKWHIALAFANDGSYSQIRAELKSVLDHPEFQETLSGWMKRNKIVVGDSLINVVLPSKSLSPALAAAAAAALAVAQGKAPSQKTP